MNIIEYPQWSHKFPTCENVIFVYNLHYFEIYFDKSLGQLNHCLVAEYHAQKKQFISFGKLNISMLILNGFF